MSNTGRFDHEADGTVFWAFEDSWKTSGCAVEQGASFFTATVSSHSSKSMTEVLHSNLGEAHAVLMHGATDTPQGCLRALHDTLHQAIERTSDSLGLSSVEESGRVIRVAVASLFLSGPSLVVVSLGASRAWSVKGGVAHSLIGPVCATDARYVGAEVFDPRVGIKESQYKILAQEDVEICLITGTPEDLSTTVLADLGGGGNDFSRTIESAIEDKYEQSGYNRMYPTSFIAFRKSP